MDKPAWQYYSGKESDNHLDESTIGRLMTTLKQMKEPPAVLIVTQNKTIARAAHQVYNMKS